MVFNLRLYRLDLFISDLLDRGRDGEVKEESPARVNDGGEVGVTGKSGNLHKVRSTEYGPYGGGVQGKGMEKLIRVEVVVNKCL